MPKKSGQMGRLMQPDVGKQSQPANRQQLKGRATAAHKKTKLSTFKDSKASTQISVTHATIVEVHETE